MADENKTTNEAKATEEMADSPRLYSEEELQRIVQKRLKNHVTQNQDLERQLAAAQQASIPVAPAAPITAPPASTENQGSPLTADAMRSMLEDSQAKASESAQAQRAASFHNQNVQKMKTEDPEFAKLSSEDNALGIPAHIAIHLSNALNSDQSKKIFKELLSNETANLRMQNAALSGTYDDWLKKILNNSMPSDEKGISPRSAPDLSREQSATNNDQSDDLLMDYIKSA